jgi:hypothetical protein
MVKYVMHERQVDRRNEWNFGCHAGNIEEGVTYQVCDLYKAISQII